MLTRRDLLRSAALLPAVLSLPALEPAFAQAVDLLKLFVPAAPGGGWDQTAHDRTGVARNRSREGGADYECGRGGRRGRASAIPQPMEGTE